MGKNKAKQGELIIAYAFLQHRNMSRIIACLEGDARRAGEDFYQELKRRGEKAALKLSESLLRKAKVIKFKHEEGLVNAVKYFVIRQQNLHPSI